MKNNWLEYKLEKESRDLPWDLKRVQLLESLIGPTAQFGVELENHLGQLTILDCDSYVYAHLSSSCDQNEVWRLVYVDLLKKAVQDANAVALMRRESLGAKPSICGGRCFKRMYFANILETGYQMTI